MSHVTCIEDLRRLARKRVPRMFYDYVDGGSWTESTYRANERDLQRLEFRQRVACDIAHRSLDSTMAGQSVSMPVAIAHRSLDSTMAGQSVSMPVAIAPTGLTGMQRADGEILAARAAKHAGIPFTLSTMSICSIEAVSDATGHHPFWFQLYVTRDRRFSEALIERARAARCSALMVTMDLQVFGRRHKDHKNGLSVPPRLTPKHLLDLACKPRWCLGMLGTRHRQFGNIVGHAHGVDDIQSLVAWTQEQFDPALSWTDVEWIKKRWGGPLIVKGIQLPGDARLAVESGADAVVVSNHGGRQLDGAASSITTLPEIVEAVGATTEIHFDSGIRSGQDALRALALGARGVYIGRAMLYGLGALGEEGVTRALTILHDELDLSMAFCGHTDIRDVNREILRRR